MSRRPKLLSIGCAVVAICSFSPAACAASRQMIVIVERPLVELESPPTSDQLARVEEVRGSLVRRFREIEMEGHLVLDGNALVEAKDTEKINSADCLAQIIIFVGNRGYRVKAKLYDATSKTWFEIGQRFFGDQNTTTLENAVANEVIPPILVRILEIAQPSSKAILLADCLAPAIPNDDSSMQAGRMFSNQYGSRLKRNKLSETYSVVPLVSNVAKFYTWWCTELPLPRKGIQREDTFTITGSVENLKTTPPQIMVSIQIKKSDRSSPASDWVLLDRNDPAGTTNRIVSTIQELANGL